MYEKIRSMEKINSMNLNMQRWCVPETYEEYLRIINDWVFVTIRTDHETKTYDLPFYIIEQPITLAELKNIWKELKSKNCKLIISDGIKFDKIQEYNMVISIEKDGQFMFEASLLKIPLRHLYKHPQSMLSCQGCIGEDPNHWINYNPSVSGLNKAQIKKDIEDLYCTYQEIIFGKTLEITKYPIPVGTQKKNIVFWQMLG